MLSDLQALVQPSLAALLALVVVSLLRGWIVPGSTVNRLLAAERQRVEDAREALKLADERADKLAAQNDQLAEAVKGLLPYARNVDTLLTEAREHMGRDPS